MTIVKVQSLLAQAGGPARIFFKFGCIAALLFLTNPEALDRIMLQLTMRRPGAFLIYLAVWALALAALAAIALERRFWVRLLWAVPVALSSAVAWGYYAVSHVELTVFDGLSLWEARHEASNATREYLTTIGLAVLLFSLTLIALVIPVRTNLPLHKGRWLLRLGAVLALLPAAPIVAIAGIIYVKAGAGSFGMPKQFSQLSIAGLVVYKQLLQPRPAHAAVTWTASPAKPVRKILLLVDESVRSDYLDPSGAEMPGFAAAMKNFVNYGPAASGGVCSNYSNSLLRYAASRSDLGPKLGANSTIWQFAKRAGYRTVYIDAQARNITALGNLQNFMTPAERADIDVFYAIKDFDPDAADFELARIAKAEMAGEGPVFIYANKQGAHVPYDQNFPAASAKYHPTIGEAGAETLAVRINSYRNSLAWNVDHFFEAFWPGLDTRDAAIVYTSDHAQYLNPLGLTHCVSAAPNQRMALVPLYAFAAQPDQQAMLKQGASKAQGRANHFMIAPTLLAWMGYAQRDIDSRYHESLTAGTPYDAEFTAGDIFGLFGNAPLWSHIDLKADLKSTEELAPISDAAPVQPQG